MECCLYIAAHGVVCHTVHGALPVVKGGAVHLCVLCAAAAGRAFVCRCTLSPTDSVSHRVARSAGEGDM